MPTLVTIEMCKTILHYIPLMFKLMTSNNMNRIIMALNFKDSLRIIECFSSYHIKYHSIGIDGDTSKPDRA